MSVSPFKTTLTNILLPNPVFSTDSLGGLAALSQLSPQSFDSTQSTLVDAFNSAQAFQPVTGVFSLGAPVTPISFESSALNNFPALLPAAPAPVSAPPVETQKSPKDDGETQNSAAHSGDSASHNPHGGPPGQMKKADSSFDGSLNRKGSFGKGHD